MASELDLLTRTSNVERGNTGALYQAGVEVIDRYSGFDHRVSEGVGTLVTPPGWFTRLEDKRRVVAYRVAKAAQETVVRFFHERDVAGASDYWQNREHGHASAYIDRLVGAILGEDPQIQVEGAVKLVPNSPTLPRKPDPLPEDADEIDKLAFEAATEFYKTECRRLIDDWKKRAAEQPRKVARQERLQRWARTHQFWQTISENEEDNVAPLGDGVLVLSIGQDGEPKVECMAPDGFQKVWEPNSRSDFPERIHLAWEYQRNGPDGTLENVLRRVTYELLPVGAPWKPAYQEKMATHRCFYSEAEWVLTGGSLYNDRGRPIDLDELPTSRAQFIAIEHPFEPGVLVDADRVPLPIDWIPVVHVKHTLGIWGRSAFARVMALLDDMNAVDTAAALVANLCGEPPIMFSGGVVEEDLVLGAAAAINLGPDGKGAKLGFADELRALIEMNGALERQFMKMTSLSSELSGRENNEQSGRAIGLKMTPFRQTILWARLARQHSYDLTLKFVQRLAIIAGTEGFEGDDVMDATLRWGTFIPEDLSGLVEMITLLRDRGLLTDSDVYDLLTEAGLDIADPDASLQELRSLNVRIAAPLQQILGRRAAARFLERDFDEDDPSLQENAPKPAFGGGGGFGAPSGGSATQGSGDAPAIAGSGRANPGSGNRNQTGPGRQRSQPRPTP